MKKVFTLLLAAFMMLAFSACNSCDRQIEKEQTVEEFILADTAYMTANYDTTYVWFETQIVLNNYLDEESCDGSFEKVINIFEVITKVDSASYNTLVVKMIHIGDSLEIQASEDFWIEDMVMNKEPISLTYAEAFNLMNTSNYMKPHTKYCVLRKEVGLVVANAQYIFGDIVSQIYVDAITGDVSDESPSFPNNEVEIEDCVNDTVQ